MVETRSTGCRSKKADDQPQGEMRVEPRDSPESPSVTENTTTGQMTHREATVAEPSKSAVSTSSKRAPTVKSKTSRRRELARAKEECARALYEAAKAKERLARAVKARIEAGISSEEESEAASVTERSRERVRSWLETQPPRDESPSGGSSAPERKTTAVDSRDMWPEIRGRSPPCPRKESPSRPEENTTVLRDETGAEVCTNRESKNTEIEGIVTALKEIVKCLPRSQAQHQPSNCTDLKIIKYLFNHF
ncbi:hypothetical protein EVAR_87157_1 [Eumeta japonica]|uniref:Uncharacterized protein n=1 Tax=Eumeta variegata TaxID=151549 RepID=A0A4C1VTX0_EUMVA|nr:hypothetical protein EVAR_87157_1 [Eumeta japonica]